MGPFLATVLFLVLAVGWILLPLVPAFVELVRKTDAEPLRVVRRSETDIRHFANGFREFLHSHFMALLKDCAKGGMPILGHLEDGTPFRVLPEGRETLPAAGIEPDGPEDNELTLACGNLHLEGEKTYLREIYSKGSLHAGAGAVLRAALAEQSVYLGTGCTTYRWLHAGADIHADPECRFYGRVSADRLIRLATGCRFERLHAPRIEFGENTPVIRTETGGALVDLDKHHNLRDNSAGRYLISKKLEIPAGGRVEGDIVVSGNLKIGDWSHIIGSLKADGDLEIGRGVRIEGAVVSGHDLKLEEGCVLDGPVVAEHKAEVGAACIFGSPQHPTTLSARGLKIGPGVVAHGTVWGGDS